MHACARGLGAGLRGAEVSAPSHPRPLPTWLRWLSGASPGSHSLLRPARPAPEVSVFGARRLPTPAAQGPLNLLRA